MSFGCSIGDFVLLIQLAYTTFRNCQKAGEEYREIACEIRTLHSVLKTLRFEAQRPDSKVFNQDPTSTKELIETADGCKNVLDMLGHILAKYEGLRCEKEIGSGKKLWQKLRFGSKTEELGAIREKIITYTSTISVLLDTMQIKAIDRVESKLNEGFTGVAGEFERIRREIYMALQARAAGRNGSTLSLSSLSTYNEDNKEVWQEFRRELIRKGFRSQKLDKYKAVLQAYMLKLDQSGYLDEERLSKANDFEDSPQWTERADTQTINSLDIVNLGDGVTSDCLALPRQETLSSNQADAVHDGDTNKVENGDKAESMVKPKTTLLEAWMFGGRILPGTEVLPLFHDVKGSTTEAMTVIKYATQLPTTDQPMPCSKPEIAQTPGCMRKDDEAPIHRAFADPRPTEAISILSPGSDQSPSLDSDPESGLVSRGENPYHPASLAARKVIHFAIVPEIIGITHFPPPPTGEWTMIRTKSILRPPTMSFPEDPSVIREGVATREMSEKIDVPPDARWTKISGELVSAEVLDIGRERYEARENFVIVLRVLTQVEIRNYALATKAIRLVRREVQAVALFKFVAQDYGDLSFRPGDIITVLKRTESNNDWWAGKIGIRSGIFPSNYVRIMEEPQTSLKCGHIPDYSIQQGLAHPFGTLINVDEFSSQVASEDNPNYIEKGGKNYFGILEQPYEGKWGTTTLGPRQNSTQKSQGARGRQNPQRSSASKNSLVVTVTALPPIPIG